VERTIWAQHRQEDSGPIDEDAETHNGHNDVGYCYLPKPHVSTERQAEEEERNLKGYDERPQDGLKMPMF